MSINNSLLNDVEKLFIKFFEAYHQCTWLVYSSDYSLTDDFRKLRYHFTLNNDNGLLDDEGRQAYFKWELDYLNQLNSVAKPLGYSINYKHVDQDNRGIYVSFDFSMPKEELLTKCLGRTAQLVETYASADHRSFLEFMDRHGIDAPDNDDDHFAVTFDVVLQCTYLIDESGYGETIIDAALVTHVKSSREEYQSYFDDNNDDVERTLTELARCKVFGSEVFNVRVTDINFDDYRN